MAKTKADRFAFHKANIGLAEDTVKGAIQEEDGEQCFNLYLYLQRLESRLETVLNGNGSPVGRFEIASYQTARYLWCCLALAGGDKPDGNTFRGMPILD